MSLLAMALLWTGSQIPVYLYGNHVPHFCALEIRYSRNRV